MPDAELSAIGSFLHRIEAEIVQGVLKAEGIDAMVSAEEGGLRPGLGLHGVRLLVRSKDIERASRVIDGLLKQ